jgi:hypothetical protein
MQRYFVDQLETERLSLLRSDPATYDAELHRVANRLVDEELQYNSILQTEAQNTSETPHNTTW